MISSDSHIVEPPDLRTERIDAPFRGRAPTVGRDPKTGSDWWMIDDYRVASSGRCLRSTARSTFPRSREITAKVLAGVPAEEQRMILRDNVAALYGFDVAALKSAAEGGT